MAEYTQAMAGVLYIALTRPAPVNNLMRTAKHYRVHIDLDSTISDAWSTWDPKLDTKDNLDLKLTIPLKWERCIGRDVNRLYTEIGRRLGTWSTSFKRITRTLRWREKARFAEGRRVEDVLRKSAAELQEKFGQHTKGKDIGVETEQNEDMIAEVTDFTKLMAFR